MSSRVIRICSRSSTFAAMLAVSGVSMKMSIVSVVQNAFVQPKYTFIVGKLAIKTGIVGR